MLSQRGIIAQKLSVPIYEKKLLAIISQISFLFKNVGKVELKYQ
jgi:hypothetical protein